jgi:hypothetical protein
MRHKESLDKEKRRHLLFESTIFNPSPYQAPGGTSGKKRTDCHFKGMNRNG